MFVKKDEKSFLDKFTDLTNQMDELVKSASDDELKKIGIKLVNSNKEAPKIPLEPKTEKEFLQNLVLRLTGDKNTYIIQKADDVYPEDLEPFLESKRPIINPSVIKPQGAQITFNPYITFFTVDGKLAMLPYDGQFFSDMETPVGKIDPMAYRRG